MIVGCPRQSIKNRGRVRVPSSPIEVLSRPLGAPHRRQPPARRAARSAHAWPPAPWDDCSPARTATPPTDSDSSVSPHEKRIGPGRGVERLWMRFESSGLEDRRRPCHRVERANGNPAGQFTCPAADRRSTVVYARAKSSPFPEQSPVPRWTSPFERGEAHGTHDTHGSPHPIDHSRSRPRRRDGALSDRSTLIGRPDRGDRRRTSGDGATGGGPLLVSEGSRHRAFRRLPRRGSPRPGTLLGCHGLAELAAGRLRRRICRWLHARMGKRT